MHSVNRTLSRIWKPFLSRSWY